jgi:stage II sporulation protein Q
MNEQNQMKPNSTGWRKLLAKRWLFPVMYVAVAGIMLTLMWVYQNDMIDSGQQQAAVVSEKTDRPANNNGQPTGDVVAVNKPAETMIWPHLSDKPVQVVLPFYDVEAPAAARQQALVEYDRTYVPHTGIDFARKDQKPFPVISALSGTVTRVETHPLLGQFIEITHENNLVTVYQSLSRSDVKPNAQVKQGDIIAQAGRNEFEKDLGVHLHFEVRQNGLAVNPTQWIPKQP